MNYTSIFENIVKWFDEYTALYLNIDQECSNAAKLKYDHTRRVCENTEAICASIEFGERETGIAKIIAVLHDVARYEQFLKYRTFSDHMSINHAELAIQIISEKKILQMVPVPDSEIIKTAIQYHSAKMIPSSLDDLNRLFCNIIRDSDKLDIFHIATSHYKNPDIERKSFELGLIDNTLYSPDVCESVYDGKIVDYKKIRYLNDFKLAQIGWVYDLNFPCSFRIMRDKGYFQMLKSELPSTREILRAVTKAEQHLMANLDI